MACPIKQHLSTAINEVVQAMDEAVKQLVGLSEEGGSKEFHSAHDRVKELRTRTDAAMKEFEDHRREHGC